jgi:tRNA dimethylallyltransferase
MDLARRRGGEIVSVDSMQVYRDMNIGTAKPTARERARVAHHMVDLVDPIEEFSVAEFRKQGRSIIESATVPMIICGGSGLHFRSLVDPMSFAPTDPDLRRELEGTGLDVLVSMLVTADPEAHLYLDLANKRRVVRAVEIGRLGSGFPSERFKSEEAVRLRRYVSDFEFLGFGIDPGDGLESRVASRLQEMISAGLLEEVRDLEPRMGRTARAAIGYRELLDAFAAKTSVESALAEIGSNTMKLARRQRTWFQRDPRISWIPWSSDPAEIADQIEGLWNV